MKRYNTPHRRRVIKTRLTELAELKEELPGKWEYYIDRLSGYIASSGKQYKNHAATIRRWAADDRAKEKPKKGNPRLFLQRGRKPLTA